MLTATGSVVPSNGREEQGKPRQGALRRSAAIERRMALSSAPWTSSCGDGMELAMVLFRLGLASTILCLAVRPQF
jgi:hypothetical protein